MLSLFVIIPLLMISGISEGEDRTEKIADSKGWKELVYRNNVLAEDRSFDVQGAILTERFFNTSLIPIETRNYIRVGGRITRVDAVDEFGSPSGSMTYRYDRNGRLLGINSEGAFGAGTAGMIASLSVPQGTWVSNSGHGSETGDSASMKTTVLGYDESGRATIVQTMQNGKAISIEKRVLDEDGLIVSVQIEDSISGLSTSKLYDSKGRVSRRTDTSIKGQPTRTEYRYDDSGRLAEELSFRGGHRASTVFSYSEDGSVVREETSRDSVVLLSITYIENGRIEELYENGIVFVKATYIGGRKVKDEFYLDGVPIRAREY